MKKKVIILAIAVLSIISVLGSCRSQGGPIPCPRHSIDFIQIIGSADFFSIK